MTMQRLAVEDNPLAGTPYRATRLLGTGFSAHVFEAIGPRGETCAVKVLRESHRTSPRAAWRVLQEGRVLASLHHPSLVELRDIGLTGDGRPYFVMPRLRGETLRDRILRTGPLPLEEASLLMAGILDGLEVAHRAGIIHRDIKPANILVTSGRFRGAPAAGHHGARAVLIDFGIAKIEGAALRTTTDQILGTPRYFAPEQVLGGKVDARTDVYAAGLVLLEAISGRAPYDNSADFIDLMHAHLTTRPEALDSLVGSSSELERITARALHKSPTCRWPTAAAFAEALRDVFPCEVASPISHRRVTRRGR
jgi:eukaryotic-like serine/threonine-protein kinase